MDSQLVKRIKSFLWRAGMIGVAAALAWIAENLNLLELSTFWTTMLGLGLGELSKYLNTGK